MTKQVEAVYENGMLRLLEPLPLEEHQRVTVLVSEHRAAERSHLDADYLAAVKGEVAAMGSIPTLDEVRAITAKDPHSWAETIIAEREERF